MTTTTIEKKIQQRRKEEQIQALSGYEREVFDEVYNKLEQAAFDKALKQAQSPKVKKDRLGELQAKLAEAQAEQNRLQQIYLAWRDSVEHGGNWLPPEIVENRKWAEKLQTTNTLLEREIRELTARMLRNVEACP